MGTKELRKREVWQDINGPKAGAAERNFFEIFLAEFKDSDLKNKKALVGHFNKNLKRLLF